MRVRIVQALVLIVVFLFVSMFVIVSSYFAFGLSVLLKLILLLHINELLHHHFSGNNALTKTFDCQKVLKVKTEDTNATEQRRKSKTHNFKRTARPKAK